MLILNDTESTKDWYDDAGWIITPVKETLGLLVDWRSAAETGGGFELVRLGEHDEERAEDLAIAERALDEYGTKGIEGTVSYSKYRTNRLEIEP